MKFVIVGLLLSILASVGKAQSICDARIFNPTGNEAGQFSEQPFHFKDIGELTSVPAGYKSWSYQAKLNLILQRHQASVYAKGQLPMGYGLDTLIANISSFLHLQQAFASSEQFAANMKVIHRLGTGAAVRFEPNASAVEQYSGLYANGFDGILRISAATPPSLPTEKAPGSYLIGAAIQVPISGIESRSAFFMPGSDYQPQASPFVRTLRNKVPPPSGTAGKVLGWWFGTVDLPFTQPVHQWADINQDGSKPESVRSPAGLALAPNRAVQLLLEHNSNPEFRELLQDIPAGTVLWYVYAVSPTTKKLSCIGQIRLLTPLTPSLAMDLLKFLHNHNPPGTSTSAE